MAHRFEFERLSQLGLARRSSAVAVASTGIAALALYNRSGFFRVPSPGGLTLQRVRAYART